MAQVTHVASNTTTNTSIGLTTTVVTKPAGVADGDLLLIAFGTNLSGMSITTLAGWTLLGTLGTTGTMKVYWKVASGEGASWTWTHDSILANQVLTVGASALRSNHQSTPIELSSSLYDSTSDTTANGTTITTLTSPQAVLFAVVHAPAVNSSVSGYAVANNNPIWTEVYDVGTNNGSGNDTMSAAYANYDFAQATGAFTATLANAAVSHVFLLSIRPAGFTFSPAVFTALVANPSIAGAGLGFAPPVLNASESFKTPTETTASLKFSNTSKNGSTFTNQSKS